MAVLVELERGPAAGGHVKCWERFAEAAVDVNVDLTVYTLGTEETVEPLADNVRFETLRPVWDTRRLGHLVGGVDPSDLAPYHSRLARRLRRHDVWHVTHLFAFAATAVHLARRGHHPLVGSVHTDVPMLTAMYAGQVVDGLPPVLRRHVASSDLARVAPALARRRRDRVLGACDWLLASNPADHHELAATVPQVPVSRLRRGVDTALFSPDRADRAWLARRCGVPKDLPLVLFVGRVDVTKGAPTVAEAVRRLSSSGRPAHLVVAGQGAATGAISSLLGERVTFLGHLAQCELARVYASCDVLAFPSLSETAGNVVAEAMAAGLPVVLPRGARTGQWLSAPGEDGILVGGGDADAWSSVLAALVADPEGREAIGRRARATALADHPSWADVVREDLLPVWQGTARGTCRADSRRSESVQRKGGAHG